MVERRYLKSLHGTLHALASILALVLGNWAFVKCVLLSQNLDTATKLVFFLSSTLSAGTVVLFFWNKVQAWQLSTTTAKEKRLSAKTLQNLNRCRGALSIMVHALLPTVVYTSSSRLLEDPIFSKLVGFILMIASIYCFILVKDYTPVVYTVHGMSKFFLGLSIMAAPSIASFLKSHPQLLTAIVEQEAYFVITCNEFGFLWYYLYSRRLVGKAVIQAACKWYHSILVCVWIYRLEANQWWELLPAGLLWIHPIVVSMLFGLFCYKLVVKLPRIRIKVAESSKADVRSSLRRSSVFEAIDVGDLMADTSYQD